MVVDIESYYGKSPGAQCNAMSVRLGDLTIYFSYRTPVAFRTRQGMVARVNEWGPTTGKHLRAAGSTADRVTGQVFEGMLEDELRRLGEEA